ncbi:hypothetical protein ACTA71_000227 [Dictyostelium dimigraforme]
MNDNKPLGEPVRCTINSYHSSKGACSNELIENWVGLYCFITDFFQTCNDGSTYEIDPISFSDDKDTCINDPIFQNVHSTIQHHVPGVAVKEVGINQIRTIQGKSTGYMAGLDLIIVIAAIQEVLAQT